MPPTDAPNGAVEGPPVPLSSVVKQDSVVSIDHLVAILEWLIAQVKRHMVDAPSGPELWCVRKDVDGILARELEAASTSQELAHSQVWQGLCSRESQSSSRSFRLKISLSKQAGAFAA